MTRSPAHLRALLAASGVIAAVVLVTDANRLWLAAGPALLSVLDAAVLYGTPARARRRITRPGGFGAPPRLVIPRYLRPKRSRSRAARDGVIAIVGVAVGSVATGEVVSVPWWGRGLLILAFVVALIALAAAARAVFSARTLASELPFAVGGIHATHEGTVVDIDDMVAALLTDTPAVVLGIVATEISDSEMSLVLARAQRVVLVARRGGPQPVFCDVLRAAPMRRVVVVDAITADLLRANLREGPIAHAIQVGEARYPDDATDAADLLLAAFRDPASLSEQ